MWDISVSNSKLKFRRLTNSKNCVCVGGWLLVLFFVLFFVYLLKMAFFTQNLFQGVLSAWIVIINYLNSDTTLHGSSPCTNLPFGLLGLIMLK